MMRATACAPAEVLHILQRAVSPKTDREGRFSMEKLIEQGQCFKLTDDSGQIIGAYVLQALDSTLWVLAAAAKAQHDMTAALIALTTIQAQQLTLTAVGFRTERPGLVRKASRAGFAVTHVEDHAFYMRKYLQ